MAAIPGAIGYAPSAGDPANNASFVQAWARAAAAWDVEHPPPLPPPVRLARPARLRPEPAGHPFPSYAHALAAVDRLQEDFTLAWSIRLFAALDSEAGQAAAGPALVQIGSSAAALHASALVCISAGVGAAPQPGAPAAAAAAPAAVPLLGMMRPRFYRLYEQLQYDILRFFQMPCGIVHQVCCALRAAPGFVLAGEDLDALETAAREKAEDARFIVAPFFGAAAAATAAAAAAAGGAGAGGAEDEEDGDVDEAQTLPERPYVNMGAYQCLPCGGAARFSFSQFQEHKRYEHPPPDSVPSCARPGEPRGLRGPLLRPEAALASARLASRIEAGRAQRVARPGVLPQPGVVLQVGDAVAAAAEEAAAAAAAAGWGAAALL